MTGDQLSASIGMEALTPTPAVHGPEQHPQATETERKLRRRAAATEQNSEDSLTPPEDEPAHQVDDIA